MLLQAVSFGYESTGVERQIGAVALTLGSPFQGCRVFGGPVRGFRPRLCSGRPSGAAVRLSQIEPLLVRIYSQDALLATFALRRLYMYTCSTALVNGRFLMGISLLIVMATQLCAGNPVKTQANVPVELTFHSTTHQVDPFNEVTLDAVFTDPDGARYRVPGFWDGGQVWKVRYASPRTGAHLYKTICSDPADHGLNGLVGSVEVTPYRGTSPLFKHGPVRAAQDRRHLAYADGTPFFWLGDTWWMGLANRLRWPDEFQTLTADRVKKGFTVVQIVAGLYPDMFPFDKRGENEAGFPWEADYKSINPAYFDRADERIGYLIDHDIAPCIVGAWGYFLPWMGVEKLERHWRYLIARYGASPVVWCAAGEANLPWYLAPKFPYDDREQVHGWTEILRYIRKTDPFHRLLTIHPTAINSYSSHHATDDPSLLDFDMLQTPHGQEGAAEGALKQMIESYAVSPHTPVIDGEAAYEMLGDSLPTRWTRAMFWICMMSGAAGHTYGANGIWQNNRPGDPHGNSPHGGNYGKISSQDAMNLPGSTQLALAKRLFEQYPWFRFQPHPEWARYEESESATLEGSDWIWFPEGNPAEDAPVATRFFRATLDVSSAEVIADARLILTADDAANVYLNGEKVGETRDWREGVQIPDLKGRIRKGKNVLAVEAENLPASVKENPAGLIAAMSVRFTDGTVQDVRSDVSWKASNAGPSGWNGVDFDDQTWPAALDIGRYGCAPWGNAGPTRSPIGPLSTGISGKVRFTYVLNPAPIVVCHLGSHARYRVKVFEPVSGNLSELGVAEANDLGEWSCAPPPGCQDDWVLVMENVKD